MSIRSVFLDFYNTLCYFHPSREDRQSLVWRQFGLNVSVETIRKAYVAGDQFWTVENARRPIQELSAEERDSFTTRYERFLLGAAGVEASADLAREIYGVYSKHEKALRLFDDIEPTLRVLKEAGMTIGVISNSDSTIDPICRDLGVADYFSFILSSCDVGCEKPDPVIFDLALRKAGVAPDEAVHVGDQYHADVEGSRALGITPFLLDRHDLMDDKNDCYRIRGLGELLAYLGLPLCSGDSVSSSS